MISDSDGNNYESYLHQALDMPMEDMDNGMDVAQNKPSQYQDDPVKNYQNLTPQQREDTFNSWKTIPGDNLPYSDYQKMAPDGPMLFLKDGFNHNQDNINKLKEEFDMEHYQNEKGDQILVPRPKAPLVG